MPALIALIPGWSQRRLPFTSSTRSLDCQADWLYARISDSRDSQGTRFPSPPISYLTSIPFMLHSAIGFSCLFVSWALLVSAVGCVVLWPALRSLFCAWLFRSLAWLCSRSLVGPGLAVRFLWFSAGSATGYSVAGFPLRVSLLVVLFGRWLSPRPLAISSRGWAWCRLRFFSFVGSAWSWFAFSARASFGLAGWLCPPVLFARPR